MPVSSVSQVFTPSDPVMENDLDLLAKVNTWQEDNFEEGAKDLQNEVDNWAMLSDVAKPQDKQYINTKLNNLVNKINDYGGVNLADPNNVNGLKSLGYNLYGDQAVINAVSTTKKMQALQQDIANKMASKNAKDYDPVYGNYLLNKYNDWINDNQVGTAYDGATTLPTGSYDTYLKKVNDAVSKLIPDENSVPQGDLDKSLGYYQIDNKYISKDKVLNAISAVTDSQDMDIIKAHAWDQMRGFSNTDLASMQDKYFENTINDLQSQYNVLKAQKTTSNSLADQQAYASQLTQLDSQIKDAQSKRKSFFDAVDGKEMNSDVRDGVTSNLFYDAFVNQYANSHSYSQQKTDYKFNQPLAFLTKQNQDAYQFSVTAAQAKDNYNLDVQKEKAGEAKDQFDMTIKALESGDPQIMALAGIKGPASTGPLAVLPLDKKDVPILTPEGMHKNAHNVYTAAQQKYYTAGYTYLATNVNDDNIHSLLKQNDDGSWGPRQPTKEEIASGNTPDKRLSLILDSKVNEYSTLADKPISQRGDYNQDENDFFNSLQDLKQAGVYVEQMKSAEDKAFKTAYGDNDAILPENKFVTFDLSSTKHIKYDYRTFKTMLDNAKADPTGKDAQTINALKQTLGSNEPQANYVIDNTDHGFVGNIGRNIKNKLKEEYNGLNDMGKAVHPYTQFLGITPKDDDSGTAYDNAVKTVSDYYSDASKGFTNSSLANNALVHFTSLPVDKDKKVLPVWANWGETTLKKDDPSLPVDPGSVNLIKTWEIPNMDDNGVGVKYMATFRYKDASKGVKGNQTDLTKDVDITKDVLGNTYLAHLYPQSNAVAVYGSILDQTGSTPAGDRSLQTTNYLKGTHKYRIFSVYNKDQNGGKQIIGYRIKVHIPGGGDVFINNEVDPASGENFPADQNAIEQYMEHQFGTPEMVNSFYQKYAPQLLNQQSSTSSQRTF